MNFSGFAEDRPPGAFWLPITGGLGFGVCGDVGFQELLKKTCWDFYSENATSSLGGWIKEGRQLYTKLG